MEWKNLKHVDITNCCGPSNIQETACVAPKPSEIKDMMALCDYALKQLTSRVEVLVEKLSPVLGPPRPQNTTTCDGEKPTCTELGSGIKEIARCIKLETQRVEDLLDRLEL